MYGEVNKYVRVKRPSRQEIKDYIERIDKDADGKLDREEFKNMMKVLGGNVAFRAGTMVVVTLVSPCLASVIVDAMTLAASAFSEIDVVEDFIGNGCVEPTACDFVLNMPPFGATLHSFWCTTWTF